MSEKGKKWLKYVLSVAVALAFLYWAFNSVEISKFWADFCQTRWVYILLSVAAGFFALVFRAERWYMQLSPLSDEVTRSSVWHGSNIGNFLSILLPGVGELARCGFVTKGKATYDKVFGTIIVERAWDVLAIASLFAAAFFLQRDALVPFMSEHVTEPLAQKFNLSFLNLMVIVVLLAIVFLVLAGMFKNRVPFFKKCAEFCKGILSGITSFAHMRHGWLFIIYTIAVWMMYILMTWFTFLAIPGLDHLTFSDAVFVSAIGNLASVVPTPGNIGPYHYLVGITISNIYLGSVVMTSESLVFATLSHGSHVAFWILMGVYSYIYIAAVKKKPEN